MKTFGRFLALGAALLVWSGCGSTPEKRISSQQQTFQSYPAEVQEKIRKGQVSVGFTPEQVTMARGKPDSVDRRTTAKGESEVWTYTKRASGLGIGLGIGGGSGGMGGGIGVSSGGRGPEVDLRVYFEKGVVSAVEKNER